MHSSSFLTSLLAAADGVVRKSPQVTFFWGAILIFLLFYYLGTADHRKKKLVGTVLSVLMAFFCIWAISGWNVFLGKPINMKLGMDLAGGSEFTVELKPGVDIDGKEKTVTPDSVQQAIGIIEKRLNPDGAKDLLMAPQGEKRILIQMPGVSAGGGGGSPHEVGADGASGVPPRPSAKHAEIAGEQGFRAHRSSVGWRCAARSTRTTPRIRKATS